MFRKRTLSLTLALAVTVSALLVGASHSTASPLVQRSATATPCKKPTGKPIRIGGTLSLTGAVAASSIIHKVVADAYLKKLNECDGLLGRPVDYRLLDDQSNPANVPQLYEQLISEGVDLIVGPFGTANITAAVQVAQRHNRFFLHATSSNVYNYDCQFSTLGGGVAPSVAIPNLMFRAFDAIGRKPKTIAFITSAFPSTSLVSTGVGEYPGFVYWATSRGHDVVLNIRTPFPFSDFNSIAAQIRAADPDFIVHDAAAGEPANLLATLAALRYKPKGVFALFPAPGPLLALGPLAENVFTVTPFVSASKPGQTPAAREVSRLYAAAARAAGLPYTGIEIQAASGWTMWDILVEAVKRAKSIDDDKLCAALLSKGKLDKSKTVTTTLQGKFLFGSAGPPGSNLYPTKYSLVQVQNGRLVLVYPRSLALPGVKPVYPNP